MYHVAERPADAARRCHSQIAGMRAQTLHDLCLTVRRCPGLPGCSGVHHGMSLAHPRRAQPSETGARFGCCPRNYWTRRLVEYRKLWSASPEVGSGIRAAFPGERLPIPRSGLSVAGYLSAVARNAADGQEAADAGLQATVSAGAGLKAGNGAVAEMRATEFVDAWAKASSNADVQVKATVFADAGELARDHGDGVLEATGSADA